MNKQIENFARESLKRDLGKLSEGNIILFKRMYANGNLDLPIETVIDKMPIEKLDWAMEQVRRTLEKICNG
jgi:hypothetical protein